MKWRDFLSLSAIAALSLALLPSNAVSQQKSLKDQLVGTWSFVSWEAKDKNGNKRIPTEGEDPQGTLIFDSAGGLYFMLISNLPKLASGERLTTTPTEDRAVAHGIFSYFGTYSIIEAEKTIIFHVKRSSYPNQVGDSRRIITSLTASELKVTSPVSTSGGTNDWAFTR